MKCLCCHERQTASTRYRLYCHACGLAIGRNGAYPQSIANRRLANARLTVLRMEIAMFPERFAPPVGCAPAKENAPASMGETGAAGDKTMAETG